MKYYNLDELHDSRLLYDKNPPRFMFIVIGLTLFLLGGAVTASAYLHKPYVVNVEGLVTSSEKNNLWQMYLVLSQR